jgi:hypothetical protein
MLPVGGIVTSPVVELPVVELPVVELPVVELPVVELPVVELPVALFGRITSPEQAETSMIPRRPPRNTTWNVWLRDEDIVAPPCVVGQSS